MSAGLAASTVTPGRTAPVVSLTTPAMVAACCAEAAKAMDNVKIAAIAPDITNLPRSIAASSGHLRHDSCPALHELPGDSQHHDVGSPRAAELYAPRRWISNPRICGGQVPSLRDLEE